MNWSELVSRYHNGERDFSGVCCRGYLIDENLRGINLTGATIGSTSLNESNFEDATLVETNMSRSSLRKMNLAHTDLTRANLSDSGLQGTNLEQANLTAANLLTSRLVDANLRHANLTNADLRYTDLRRADLTGANLTETNLIGANLCQANLTNAIVSEAMLQKAILGWTMMPDGSISHDPAMDLIDRKLQHLKRTAWKPITIRKNGELTASKFAGKPWLSPDEAYPCCPKCQLPMDFFLQLNLQEMPESIQGKFGEGLLQFFYCRGESCIDSSHTSSSKLVRIVPLTHLTENSENHHLDAPTAQWPLLADEFPPRQIVSWQETNDYPCLDEADLNLGVSWSRAEGEVIREVVETTERKKTIEQKTIKYHYYSPPDDECWLELSDDEDGLDLESEERIELIHDFMNNTGMYPIGVYGDKLGGYPYWFQDETYPDCPTCNQSMNQCIFQFSSEDNIPYDWCDGGRGYILQCPDHHDQVTFFWQP